MLVVVVAEVDVTDVEVVVVDVTLVVVVVLVQASYGFTPINHLLNPSKHSMPSAPSLVVWHDSMHSVAHKDEGSFALPV